MSIRASFSIRLRSLRRASICSVSWVNPSASKAFDGLKTLMSVWLRLVSEAFSSSKPFGVNVRAASSPTACMKGPRPVWMSSMVCVAAIVASASAQRLCPIALS